MSWSMVAGAAITVVGGALNSKSSKKQAEVQADAITEAGQIDTAARNKAIGQVLEIFSPSLAEFNESLQGSIDLMEQGRISTGDLLTQSANNVSQIVQQGGQSALNAMLGLPSPANDSVIQQSAPANTKGVAPNNYQRDINPADYSKGAQSMVRTTQGINAGDTVPDMPMRDNYQPSSAGQVSPQNVNTRQGAPALAQTDGRVNGYDRVNGRYNLDGPLTNYTTPPPEAPAFTPTTPLEGDFIPRDYQFNQQGVTMPTGTNAGLLGAEQAVNNGANMGRFDLMQGSIGALDSLATQHGIARNDIGQGRNFALSQIQQGMNAGRDRYNNAISEIGGGVNAGVNAINRGVDSGVASINHGVNRATSYLNPYMNAGKEALDPLLALSGVRGQEAFDNALINDPAYNYGLKNSEQALSRNAAVTGGVGSGNTMARFQQNAQDYGAANIDNQLSRYRSITDRGQQAASTAGGFATQGGIAAGNIQAQGGISAGNMEYQGGINAGSMMARAGEFESGQYNNMANVGLQSSQQLAQLAEQYGMSEADVLQQLGGNLANIDVGTGNAIGGMRENAGINASQIIQNNTNQLAGIDAGLAQQLAQLDQNTNNNIVNSIQTGAGTTLSTNQQLATILANMGVNAGSSAANTAINLGQANAAGITNPIGNAINTGIGLYASGAFSGSGSGGTNPYQPPASEISLDQFTANNQNVSWRAE